MNANPSGCILVGNDTEVGKTLVACQILQHQRQRGLRVGAYKPVASGCNGLDDDIVQLCAAGGLAGMEMRICPYHFAEPVAPLVAAQAVGKTLDDHVIDEHFVWWLRHSEYLVVETAGGLCSPLSFQRSNLDFVEYTKLPAVVVIGNRLGSINQAMLVCEALLQRKISIQAILFNDGATISDSPELERVRSTNVALFQRLLLNYLGGAVLISHRLHSGGSAVEAIS